MQLNVALGRDDRVVEIVGLIVRERGHELRPRRPDGIRMLALNLVKSERRGVVLTFDEVVHRLVVEILYRALDVGHVPTTAIAASDDGRQQKDGESGVTRTPHNEDPSRLRFGVSCSSESGIMHIHLAQWDCDITIPKGCKAMTGNPHE